MQEEPVPLGVGEGGCESCMVGSGEERTKEEKAVGQRSARGGLGKRRTCPVRFEVVAMA